MRRFWIVALSGAVACSSDPTSPDASIPECFGPVSIQVSSGTSPTFDWTPQCRVSQVFVQPTIASSENRWMVSANTTNVIAPPVRYGQLPAGATLLGPLLPLQLGETYVVTLLYKGRNPFSLAGRQEFVP